MGKHGKPTGQNTDPTLGNTNADSGWSHPLERTPVTDKETPLQKQVNFDTLHDSHEKDKS